LGFKAIIVKICDHILKRQKKVAIENKEAHACLMIKKLLY
jgi:hypothetical protein